MKRLTDSLNWTNQLTLIFVVVQLYFVTRFINASELQCFSPRNKHKTGSSIPAPEEPSWCNSRNNNKSEWILFFSSFGMYWVPTYFQSSRRGQLKRREEVNHFQFCKMGLPYDANAVYFQPSRMCVCAFGVLLNINDNDTRGGVECFVFGCAYRVAKFIPIIKVGKCNFQFFFVPALLLLVASRFHW